jgi:hypothetical protein
LLFSFTIPHFLSLNKRLIPGILTFKNLILSQVEDLSNEPQVERELMLVKVNTDPKDRAEVMLNNSIYAEYQGYYRVWKNKYMNFCYCICLFTFNLLI